MFKVFVFGVLVLLSSGLLTSCDNGKGEQIQQLQNEVIGERKSKEKERVAREVAEERAAKTKSDLSLLIGMSVTGMLVAGFIGVAIGSRARKDSLTQKSTGKSNKL